MLSEQVIIVTGGAAGIGRGIADVLTADGARVAIVQPDIKDACIASERIPGAKGFSADISDPAQVQHMVEQVASQFGRIDGLVNNASLTGLPAAAAFTDTPMEQVHRIIDVNVKGTIWCSQTVARYLIENRRRGGIVHIVSVGAFAAQEFASIYCASKAAQASLTQSMALELAAYGIRVNAVAPGDIDTQRSSTIASDLLNLGATGQYWRKTPLGRRGSATEIGEAVAFLLSEKAAFITGTVLRVDGGFLTY